jgi:two-component system chemotaxis response regulator CheB
LHRDRIRKMRVDIVAIGGSAGAVEAVKVIIAGLPADFAAAVLVTIHIGAQTRSLLPEILEMAGPLPVRHAQEGRPLRRGQVLVAPPDHHLIVVDGVVSLSRGARENGSRPALDPMFRSAARAYGQRVVGVVLSGTLDDGAAGLTAIKARGGVTIAQSPGTSIFSDMPRSSIEAGVVDSVLPLPDIAPRLVELAGTVELAGDALRGPSEAPVAATVNDVALVPGGTEGSPTGNTYSCPDCGGVLQLSPEGGGPQHFRCMVGHAWSSRSLLAAQLEHIEESLWAALRALEEHRKLTHRMLIDARAAGSLLTTRYEERLRDLELNAARIRAVLLHPVRGAHEPGEVNGSGDGEEVAG